MPLPTSPASRKGGTLEDYKCDRMLRQTIERNFEIIGEAVNRLVQHDPDAAARIGSHGKSSISATCSSTVTT
jgi:hypothetical protein